jgi:WhiB family redox-sensing transcriptional regulator
VIERLRPEKPSSWMADAACAGHPRDLWHPEHGGPSHGVRLAVMICRSCPVRAECLAYAQQRPVEEYGIWGGLMPLERRHLRDLPVRVGSLRHPIKHGTAGGYRTHRRRDEEACAACLLAHREANRRRLGMEPA